MAKEKLLKNLKGEYNYHFNWIDEDGITCGFNNVWALNKKEAVKRAKEMESKARWSVWSNELKEYVEVSEKIHGAFRNKGMCVNVKTMYKATETQSREMDRISWMMMV